VLRKQALVRQLGDRLVIERRTATAAVQAWQSAPAGESGSRVLSGRCITATAREKAQYAAKSCLEVEYKRCAYIVEKTVAELKKAEVAPPPVIQPLPESDDDAALAVLFFAFMDSVAPALRVLGKMSFSAQEALHPGARASAKGPEAKLDLVTHHDRQQLSSEYFRPSPRVRAGNQGELQLWAQEPVPEQVGPQQVVACVNPRDGV
jgi:hypothetical protein